MRSPDVRVVPALFTASALLALSVTCPALAQSRAEQAPADQSAPIAQSEAAAPEKTPDKAAEPGDATSAQTQAQQPEKVADADPRLDELRTLLKQSEKGGNVEQAALAAFYAERNGEPLWVSPSGFTARGEHALAEIARAEAWGLPADHFQLPRLAPNADAKTLAAAERALGLAALKYARYARGGRLDPQQLSPNLDQKLSLREPAAVLAAVAATDTPGDYLRSLHPRHPQFERLRQALLKARSGDTGTQAPEPVFVVLPDGPQLKSGSKHAHVPLLRQRLGLEARAEDLIFDAELVEALKAFQRDKGLQPSGQLTTRTRQVLNAAAPKPAQKPASLVPRIIANMERWRWMPEDMGAFHVWQNTPEFTVRVVRNGEVIHQARVVVGKLNNQTPVFSASMRYVVFNPEWGVPDSIKVKEILPYLKPAQNDFFSIFGGSFGGVDTRVLEKHNLRVSYNGRPVDATSVNWNEVDIRRYTFIQPAGATNVLGQVKFRFPNKHDVYMHDTPQRDLFSKEVRAFSHGCVRVQDPLRLAEVLLGEDKGWGAGQVQAALAGSGPNEIELTKQIPVHLSYFTIVVTDAGEMKVYDDLYNHDARVIAALAGRPLPVDKVAAEDAPEPGAKAKKTRRRQPVTDNLW